MKNIFKDTDKQVRAFTLIELLVVIAIIGLLSTIVAQPVTQAYKKARDAKKVSDIHAINGALQSYATASNGYYPDNIDALFISKDLQKTPANASSTANIRDKYMYVVYKDADGKNIGYHLGVKLEVNGPALDDDKDCSGMSGAGACLVANGGSMSSTNIGTTGFATNGATAPMSGDDFDGAGDSSGSVCSSTAVTGAGACVYDLTQ